MNHSLRTWYKDVSLSGGADWRLIVLCDNTQSVLGWIHPVTDIMVYSRVRSLSPVPQHQFYCCRISQWKLNDSLYFPGRVLLSNSASLITVLSRHTLFLTASPLISYMGKGRCVLEVSALSQLAVVFMQQACSSLTLPWVSGLYLLCRWSKGGGGLELRLGLMVTSVCLLTFTRQQATLRFALARDLGCCFYFPLTSCRCDYRSWKWQPV